MASGLNKASKAYHRKLRYPRIVSTIQFIWCQYRLTFIATQLLLNNSCQCFSQHPNQKCLRFYHSNLLVGLACPPNPLDWFSPAKVSSKWLHKSSFFHSSTSGWAVSLRLEWPLWGIPSSTFSFRILRWLRMPFGFPAFCWFSSGKLRPSHFPILLSPSCLQTRLLRREY